MTQARRRESVEPTGRWYLVVAVVGAGLFAVVPFFHAADRLHRPELRRTGVGLTAGAILGLALMATAPGDGDRGVWQSNAGLFVLLSVTLTAVVLLAGLRREIYGPDESVAAAAAEEAQRRRDEARALAADDPSKARELGIGRPDAQRDYDDGGLLDLNAATAEQLTEFCRLPPSVAREVVATRERRGAFAGVEQAIAVGPIPEDYAPAVRERGIVVAAR